MFSHNEDFARARMINRADKMALIAKALRVAKQDGLVGLIRKTAKWFRRNSIHVPFLGRAIVICMNRRALRKLPDPLRLHLGCGGKYLEGHVNIDVEDWAGVCDILASATELPLFADDSVEHIFSHALLEHIPPWDTLRTLREWHRLLKPGGTIRIEVPDLERIYEDWLVRHTLDEQEAIHNIFGPGRKRGELYSSQHHLTGFTYDRLSRFLMQAGFQEPVRIEHEIYHHVLVLTARKAAGDGSSHEGS